VYLRIPFGLLNSKSTFQRAMDYVFKDIICKIIVIYQDDLIFLSKQRNANVPHIIIFFERFQRYGISLNPKKSIFGVKEGKLLSHIVSKEGFKIYPSRIEGNQQVPLPKNKHAM
jgi:hypothetical protein